MVDPGPIASDVSAAASTEVQSDVSDSAQKAAAGVQTPTTSQPDATASGAQPESNSTLQAAESSVERDQAPSSTTNVPTESAREAVNLPLDQQPGLENQPEDEQLLEIDVNISQPN